MDNTRNIPNRFMCVNCMGQWDGVKNGSKCPICGSDSTISMNEDSDDEVELTEEVEDGYDYDKYH